MTSGMPERTTIFAAWIFDAMPPTAVSLSVPRAIFSSVGINFFDDRNGFGIGLAEIFDDAVHGRENDEQIGGQQRRDQRGQFVVVAEFDFGERHGVVFVDDGHDAAVEQCDERVARVEMALVMFEVVMREQHLRDVQIVPREKFRVNGHEPRLADGGARLQFGEFAGPFFIAQRAHARADGAGGDEHDFLAGFSQRGDLGDELFQLRRVGLLAAVGEHAGAEFHDDAGGGFDGFTMHAAKLEENSCGENAKMAAGFHHESDCKWWVGRDSNPVTNPESVRGCFSIIDFATKPGPVLDSFCASSTAPRRVLRLKCQLDCRHNFQIVAQSSCRVRLAATMLCSNLRCRLVVEPM